MIRRGLRSRSALAFALLALALSVVLSVVTYQLSRWYLLGQRESIATRQVMLNASVARGLIAAGDSGPDDAIASLRAASNARAVVKVGERWYAAVVELNETRIPPSLLRRVDEAGAARQRLIINGSPFVAVGVRLPGQDASYFEFVPVVEYQRTLETLIVVLVVAATATTLAGAVAGWFASKRLVRPLVAVGEASEAISAGNLSQRLDVGGDRDLDRVARSFNHMARSLEERIARELRFTADVSHELRTPLTAMASAVSLAQRAKLDGRAQFAVQVLDGQVEHLRSLTLQLLEISRIDAGVAELQLEEVDVEALTCRVMTSMAIEASSLTSKLGSATLHRLDPVRFERVLSNLFENAARYAGGVTRVTLDRDAGALVVTVDDAGPGVAENERVAIFGRFHRGETTSRPDQPKGTGLGLALVDEHVRMHGGEVFVTESPDGGARFVVRVPQR
jgi:signal transduction histidine kinase